MSDKQIMAAKASLRKTLFSAINNISKSEVMRQSEIVTKKILENAEFQKAKVISIYLAMEKEIQTEELLVSIFKQGKECFIPRFQAGGSQMEMIRLSSLEEYQALPLNKWNIKQPPTDEKVESVFERGQLDLVLSPGLGFTHDGFRLGRGKGYYDKFYAKCKKELPVFPYTIGLAFKEQIVPEVPTTEQDVRLDLVVYPD